MIFGDRSIVVNDIGKRTALHELHHNPELESILLQESIQEVDNVVVSALLHYDDLIDNQLLSWLASQIHLLDSDLCSRSVHTHDVLSCPTWRTFTDTCNIHGSGRTLADLLLFVVALQRVLEVDYRSQTLHNLSI